MDWSLSSIIFIPINVCISFIFSWFINSFKLNCICCFTNLCMSFIFNWWNIIRIFWISPFIYYTMSITLKNSKCFSWKYYSFRISINIFFSIPSLKYPVIEYFSLWNSCRCWNTISICTIYIETLSIAINNDSCCSCCICFIFILNCNTFCSWKFSSPASI